MRKIRGLRWYIAIMLMLVTTINYFDRTSLGVVFPIFKDQLHIDKQHFSYIILSFQFAYFVMLPLSGRFLDWVGIKLGFSIAVTFWSIAKMLHALARGVFSFSIVRVLLGVGEAANFPGIAKVASEWFHAKERTMATGIANMGAGLGALLAPPIMIWLSLEFGWQQAFVITGVIGCFWVVPWLLFYKPPEQNPMITPEELKYITEGRKELQAEEKNAGPQKNVWKLIMGQRNFWGIALARFLSEPSWAFFSYWIPIYFTERGVNLKDFALFGWLPFLAADVGSFVGGVLSPFYHKLGFKVLTSRKLSMTTAACMMPFAFFITKAPVGWAILWFCVAAFGHQCISATLMTLPADLFPKRTVGTANGLSGSAALAGAMLFTFAVGWLVTHVGYAPVFVTIAFLDLIGAVLLWTLIREPKAETSSI
ncbi:MAG: MFS transporter [Sedimentisphaerales bacterium]